MAGEKGRFKIRGEDGRVRTYGSCQSAGQAVKKFILLANPPPGYHGSVWRMGKESDSKNFRITDNKIRQAKEDKRLKKRYLADLADYKTTSTRPTRTSRRQKGSRRAPVSQDQIKEVAAAAAAAAVAALLSDQD
jgi:hypothetical protein